MGFQTGRGSRRARVQARVSVPVYPEGELPSADEVGMVIAVWENGELKLAVSNGTGWDKYQKED